MNKFGSRLTKLTSPLNHPDTKNGVPTVLWILLGVCVLAYLVPWVVNPELSLSLGAFDLAEWVSLRLPARPLDLMLLLRLPPVCIAVIAAFSGQRLTRMWWLTLGFVILTGVALLPPIEFFTQFRDDVNYGQQFNLTLGVLVIGGIGLSGVVPQIIRHFVIVIAAVIGLASVWMGLAQANALMVSFKLPVSIGFGGVVLILALTLIVVWELINLIRA